MLAVPVPEPFDSPGRIFEVKWDGIRALAFIANRKVRLQSRNFKDITEPFADIAEALLDTVQADGVVLDGELVALDKEGLPRLPRVMRRIHDKTRWGEGPAVNFEIFDILYKGYRPLLKEPLIQRKRILNQTVSAAGPVHLCHYAEEEGLTFFQAATNLGLEGMVAKQKNSAYLPGKRSRHWLKVKATRTANLVVGGYTIGGGNRKELFGSILLGAYDKKGLRFVGSVGGGFSKDDLAMTHDLLTSAQTDDCPFVDPPEVQRLLYWCTSGLVVQVKYAEYTAAGHLRFPIFVTFRPDVDPQECTLAALKAA